MCKAMEELIKDAEARGEARGKARVEAKWEAIGEARGEAMGKAIGILKTLTDLVQKGLLNIRDAAEQVNMTDNQFREEMQKFR